MASQSWVTLLNWNNAGTPGTALASSTTLTDVSPTPQLTLPAFTLAPGSGIRVRAVFTASNTATPTLLVGVYYGGVAGIALAASSAITTTTTMTNWQWVVEYVGFVRSISSSGNTTPGTIMGSGEVRVPTSLTAWTIRPLPETALATVNIDTTTAKAITLGAQWSVASASNTLTVQQFTVESLSI